MPLLRRSQTNQLDGDHRAMAYEIRCGYTPVISITRETMQNHSRSSLWITRLPIQKIHNNPVELIGIHL